jgi:hypothetical protein
MEHHASVEAATDVIQGPVVDSAICALNAETIGAGPGLVQGDETQYLKVAGTPAKHVDESVAKIEECKGALRDSARRPGLPVILRHLKTRAGVELRSRYTLSSRQEPVR